MKKKHNPAKLVKAAKALVKKLEAAHASPEWDAVWVSAFIHRGTQYSGPRYQSEFEALKKVLNEKP